MAELPGLAAMSSFKAFRVAGEKLLCECKDWSIEKFDSYFKCKQRRDKDLERKANYRGKGKSESLSSSITKEVQPVTGGALPVEIVVSDPLTI